MSNLERVGLIVGMVLFLVLIVMIATYDPGNQAEISAERSCINRGGIPILDGSGHTMTRCEGLK